MLTHLYNNKRKNIAYLMTFNIEEIASPLKIKKKKNITPISTIKELTFALEFKWLW